MQRPKPIVIAAIAAGVLLLIILIVLLTRGDGANEDRLSDEEIATAKADEPQARCGSQATYDAIKRELFRQAAQVRGSDQAAFDRIASYSTIRMERPVLRSQDADLGTVGCSGLVRLDLPPGVAVVGGRRSLSAEIGYILQQAADGSGDVVMLEGVDPIVVPLATLARTADLPAPIEPGDNAATAVNEVAPSEPSVEEPLAPQPIEPQPEPTVSAAPSFDCRFARTRGEIQVCSDPGLAALDRQMAEQFGRALANADSGQRRLLQTTRTRFLRFRDSCRSKSCIAGAYQGRIREIADIMAGRWQPS